MLFSLVSLILGLSCYYRKQFRKISLSGNVRNIVIVSKINFRFLGNRQVQHMEGLQLILSLEPNEVPGNTNRHYSKPETQIR